MPAPLIGAAAAAAARIISQKLAQRAVGGITGSGSKSVNPIYKEVGNSRNIPIKTLGGRTVNQELARVEKLIKKNTK
jgi:hypothetical protein